MLLSRSLRRKLLATLLGAVVLMLVYQATVIDSRSVAGRAGSGCPETAPGCRSSPRPTARADDRVRRRRRVRHRRRRPAAAAARFGRQLDGRPEGHQGIYTVLDTGPEGAGPARRPLHVELPRGARLRPPDGVADRPATRLEPEGVKRPQRKAELTGRPRRLPGRLARTGPRRPSTRRREAVARSRIP